MKILNGLMIMMIQMKKFSPRKLRSKWQKNTKNPKRQCGLCGNTRKLTCCNNWICNDERNYIPFSYFSSCYRDHSRYILCASHPSLHFSHVFQSPSCFSTWLTEFQIKVFSTNSFNFRGDGDHQHNFKGRIF